MAMIPTICFFVSYIRLRCSAIWSSTVNVNSDVVYPEIISSFRIIKRVYLNSVTPWAHIDIPSHSSIPLRLLFVQEANSVFNNLQVSRCTSMAVRADSLPSVEGPKMTEANHTLTGKTTTTSPSPSTTTAR